VLVLTAFLLVGFTAAVLLPGRRSRPDSAPPDSAGFDLLADATPRKLDTTSAEAPAASQTPAPQPEPVSRSPEEKSAPPTPPEPKPPDPVPPAPQAASLEKAAPSGPPEVPTLPAPTPAPPSAVPEPPPAAVSETPRLAIVPDDLRSKHSGDTPMMRNWKTLGLSAALAAALAVPPAPALQAFDGPQASQAGDNKDKDKTDKADGAAAILKELRELKAAFEKIDTGLKESMDNLDKNTKVLIQGLRRDLNDLKSETTQIARMQTDMEALKREISQLRQEIETLRGRVAPVQSSALYPPAPGTPTGRIQLINRYLTPMTIQVNTRAYRLQPGETRVIDAVPAGPFTYQVLTVQPDVQTRQLLANEVYTIDVYPRG
jgi:hypothetical protein